MYGIGWQEVVLPLNCEAFSFYAVIVHCIALLLYPGAKCGILYTDLSRGAKMLIVLDLCTH